VIRHRPGLLLAAAISVAGATVAVAQRDSADLPETSEAARTFDYCGYPIASAALIEMLARLDRVVENDDRAHSGQAVATALLTGSGLRIANDQPDECPDIFREGQSRYRGAAQQAERLLRGQNRYDRKRDRRVREVQERLGALWLEDQQARLAYVNLRTESRSGPAFWAFRLATARAAVVDDEAASMMSNLLDEWEWVDAGRFGRKVSQFAWLLVQHADEHPELQALALQRMTPYLESGGIRKADYAYLWDRVAVNAGREQRYGTQPVWECDDSNRLALEPVEDPDRLDERRATLNMKPHQLDLDQMADGFCGR